MLKELIVKDRVITDKDLSKFFFAASTYHIDNICLPSSFINRYADLKEYVNIVGLVDFPHGLSSSKSKKIEADNLIKNGASIIDFVINHNHLSNSDYSKIEKELHSLKKVCTNIKIRPIIEYRLYEDKCYEISVLLKYFGLDEVVTSTGTIVDDPIDNIIFAHSLINNGLKPICVNITRGKEEYGVLKQEKIYGIRFTSVSAAENILGKIL